MGDVRELQLPVAAGEWAVLRATFPMTEGQWAQLLAVVHAMKPALVYPDAPPAADLPAAGARSGDSPSVGPQHRPCAPQPATKC